MTAVILLVVNILIGFYVWFRMGKQSVINDLIKAYNDVCKDNEDKQIIIKCLKEQLKQKEDAQ